MDAPDTPATKILIATDSVTDAELVKNLLNAEFDHITLSTTPSHAVTDFDHCRPDVLVLAFNELEKSERYYLGLYRLSQAVHVHPHRTIILCNKDEVKRIYELCMKDYFDDYVLFWPMTYDSSRLLMSVHYALRELAAFKSDAPSATALAAQARHLAELEGTLAQRMAQGDGHIAAANRAMEQAEQGIGTALDGLSRRLVAEVEPSATSAKIPNALQDEISRFKHEEVHQHFMAAAKSAEPLKQWAQDVSQESASRMESAHTLSAMAERVRPIILVVDDDEFQRKIISRLLEAENYHLIFANNGVQALGVLRKTQPAVILMDVLMPDMDGMEATRRLKRVNQFAKTPVIMITGNSEAQVVRDCIKAGASDFVVKPFDRNTLLAKIKHVLDTMPPQ
ncbi:MAG: response regulator [Nitrosomonadales bacterium]|nr:response regulator [Nitrosomonadales bacterium]